MVHQSSLSKTILLVTSTFICAYSFNNSTRETITLLEGINNKKIEVKATSNGRYKGKSVLLNIQNTGSKSIHVTIPAGTIYRPENPDEQPLIQLEEQLYTLEPHQKSDFTIAAFCTKSKKLTPTEDNQFEIAKSNDVKLQKLIEHIVNNKIDQSTYQDAVWAVTDNHSISNIYSDQQTIQSFRAFIAELTGQKNVWYDSHQNYTVDEQRNIHRETIQISGELTFGSDGKPPIHQEICNKDGILIVKTNKTTPHKSNNLSMYFSIRVKGWEKGNYYVRIMQGEKEIKRFNFTV